MKMPQACKGAGGSWPNAHRHYRFLPKRAAKPPPSASGHWQIDSFGFAGFQVASSRLDLGVLASA
jgi:hypothetical protein